MRLKYCDNDLFGEPEACVYLNRKDVLYIISLIQETNRKDEYREFFYELDQSLFDLANEED